MKNRKKILFRLCIGLFFGGIGVMSCHTGQNKQFSPYDHFTQFYQTIEDSMSSNPRYVCSEIQKTIRSVTDSTTYYHYIMMLSKAYMFRSEMDSAYECMNRVARYCAQAPDSLSIADLYADVYNMRGNVFARQGFVDSAVVCFSRALTYCLRGPLKESQADVSLNLADAYLRTGRYDQSSLWYRQALCYYDSLAVPESKRFSAYYGLAQVYMELRDFEQCDHYFDLAGQWYEEMQAYEKCIYLNNRGNSYYFRKDYLRALAYFRRQLAFASNYPDMVFEVHLSEINMGETFLLMNEIDSASYYLDACQEFFHSIHNKSALYYLETQLIELALKQHNLPLARKRLAEAVTPEFIEPNMKLIRNRYLQHYCEEAGDYQNAYYYQRENQRIDDSIRSERVKMRSAEIDLKYKQDTTLMRQKILIQQKENEVLALNQRNYIWMFGCISILIIVLFLYLYYKKQRRLLQLKNQSMIAALRMENIRSRVSPHFIFNILNHEMGNLREEETLNMHRLIKLMRRNLELAERLCVTLSEELDFVQTYVELERTSLGESFRFIIQCDKTIDATQVILPSMMIQIPVENAIKHALRNKTGERNLWIQIQHNAADTITIRIKDNGGGYRMSSENRGTGTGMKVIMQTIQLLNAANKKPIGVTVQNVDLANGERGCEFVVSLPIAYDYTIKRVV